MKRLILILSFMLPFSLIAQVRIAEEILKSQKAVRFTNYTGEVTNPDRVEDIIGIGKQLAALSNGYSAIGNKYYLKRILDRTNRNLFSADIFGIDKLSRVDHIKNVRRILSGYIQVAFKKQPKESFLIASFVTYYNSAVRNDPSILQKYSVLVRNSIDPAKAGIGLNYKNWPGNTEMLIPLEISPIFGSNIGSSELYERATEELKKTEDRGVREREEMLQAREKELQQKRQNLDQAFDENKRQTEKVEAAKQKTEKEEPSPQREEKLKDATVALTNLAEQRRELLKEQDKLASEREKLAEQKKELAKDKKEVNYSGVETTKYLYFMRYIGKEKNVVLKELTAIIKDTLSIGRVKKGVSGMNTPVYGDDIFSIYPNPDKSKFVITLFDGETFDIIRQSSQGVYPNTYLDEDIGKVYAVIEKEGKFYLGQFDAESLKLLNKTEKTVYPDTGIIISTDKIFLLLSDGKSLKIGAFKKEDLSFIKFVE